MQGHKKKNSQPITDNTEKTHKPKGSNKSRHSNKCCSNKCCPSICIIPTPPPTILIENTVFVDGQFGSDQTGRVNNLIFPFRTISAAILAINNATLNNQWLVKVNPGVYPEAVNLPIYINLQGSGPTLTIISSIRITGTSRISDLAITSTIYPLIYTLLNNDLPEENQVGVLNIFVNAPNVRETNNEPLISINGGGLNNQVTIENSSIETNVLNSNTSPQKLIDVNATLILKNSDIEYLASFQNTVNVFTVKNQFFIFGGVFKFRLNEGPTQEINFFNVDGGNLRVSNNSSTIVVLIITQPYLEEVSYIKVDNAGLITITDSSAELSGVSVDFLNLVNKLNPFSEVQLLGLNTPLLSAPRLKGNKDKIKYSILSGLGDLVANGGLYTNIIKVTSIEHPTGYFLQENDYTVLSTGPDVHIFDPSLANQQVIDVGKIIVIKNIGAIPIIVDSQNNTIFDSPNIILNNLESVTLQNDGIEWYVIARS